jgi:hypothetical protein
VGYPVKDVQSLEEIVGPVLCPRHDVNRDLLVRDMNLRKEVPSWQERKNPRQTCLRERTTRIREISAATAGKK